MSHSSTNQFVPRELIAKYNTAGPRYTSYPTAPEWRNELPLDEALGIIDANQRERADTPLSLYVHIPFCHKLCYYCGCNMLVTKQQDLVSQYLDAVIAEIDRMAKRLDTQRRPVVQIHWGGGTPTYLNSAQIARLFGAIAERFTIAPDAEISLELHPPVTTFEQLATLRRLGFNRVSMGVQDFDHDVQVAVNRIQPYEQTRDLIAECRRLGFLSVNTDLMYGLPFQTVEKFKATLAKVETLRPDRIALFNYAHVPWLKKHMAMIKEETLPKPDEKLDIFEYAIADLTRQGYRYIGMDHFALPENELATAQADGTLRRNFMGYTTCADSDLYAFGASSISDLDRAYLQNQRNIHDYIRLMDEQELPIVRGMALSDDDRLRREVINRLFCVLRVDKAEIAARFGIDFDATFARELAELAPLAEDGLVELSDAAITVMPRGQVLLRNIAMPFDAYLAKTPAGERRFSKTV
ncbi:MAG TPA: oxygen-independent coproporphyrinogen III oxidase [Oscillatoriaceae cyanobacterium]